MRQSKEIFKILFEIKEVIELTNRNTRIFSSHLRPTIYFHTSPPYHVSPPKSISLFLSLFFYISTPLLSSPLLLYFTSSLFFYISLLLYFYSFFSSSHLSVWHPFKEILKITFLTDFPRLSELEQYGPVW